MVAIKRGNNIDITTIDGKQLKTEYAGNYSDICPTGSLTLKDFRFRKRAWMLKKTPTVCEGCSKGCNMEVQHEGNVVYRCVPRENLEINKYWMCDEGRFNYGYVQDSSRIVNPMKRSGESWLVSQWEELLAGLRADSSGAGVMFLIGTDLTIQEMKAVQDAAKALAPKASILSFGNSGVESSAQDGPRDQILKMKSRTSNLKGAEKLGIQPLLGAAKSDVVVVFRGGRAEIPRIDAKKTYGVGVFLEKERNHFQVILPSLSFLEKDGTIVNHQGAEQSLKRALLPRGKSKAIGEILMMALHQRSGEVTA
jgi:NADH-quinone oxidoreductase subunit G